MKVDVKFMQTTKDANRIQGQFSEVLGNIPCVAVTADPFGVSIVCKTR